MQIWDTAGKMFRSMIAFYNKNGVILTFDVTQGDISILG